MGIERPLLDRHKDFLNTFTNFTKSEIERGEIHNLAFKVIDCLVREKIAPSNYLTKDKKVLETYFGEFGFIRQVIKNPKYFKIYRNQFLGAPKDCDYYKVREINGQLVILPDFKNLLPNRIIQAPINFQD